MFLRKYDFSKVELDFRVLAPISMYLPTHPDQDLKEEKNMKELLCRAKLPPAKRGFRTRAADQEARHGLTRCNKSLNRNGCAAGPFITSRPNQEGEAEEHWAGDQGGGST